MVRFIHIEHHHNTNELKTIDPDAWCSEGPAWQFPLRWATVDLWYLVFCIRKISTRPRGEAVGAVLTLVVTLGGFEALSVAGYGSELLLAFVIPQRIGLVLLTGVSKQEDLNALFLSAGEWWGQRAPSAASPRAPTAAPRHRRRGGRRGACGGPAHDLGDAPLARRLHPRLHPHRPRPGPMTIPPAGDNGTGRPPPPVGSRSARAGAGSCPSWPSRSGSATVAVPVDRAALSADAAATEWEALAGWVVDVLGPFYEITRASCPTAGPATAPR